MKRAVIFLLVLLLAVGGLCYGLDATTRTMLADTMRQMQDDKRISLASWEYDSLSRCLLLHDVRIETSSADGRTISATAREVRVGLSLRAILHGIPALDFLLSPQGYLTLLDDWQLTEFALRQTLPTGGEDDFAAPLVTGEALAVTTEQFKKLRAGDTESSLTLSQYAFRALRLEKPTLSQRQPHQSRPHKLEAEALELEKGDIRQDRIGGILLQGFSSTAGADALRLKEMRLTDLRPATLLKAVGAASLEAIWDAISKDVPCTTLRISGSELFVPDENGQPFSICGFDSLELTRGEEGHILKHAALNQVRLALPPTPSTPQVSLSFARSEVNDLDLVGATPLLREGLLAWPASLDAGNPAARESKLVDMAFARPLFSRYLARDIRLSLDNLSASAEQIGMTWTMQGDTQRTDNTITNLVIPTAAVNALLPTLTFPGLQELRFTFTDQQSLSNGISTVNGKAILDGLCELTYSCEGKARNLLTPPPVFRHLDLRLTDKGLMAIVALNIDKDPAVARMTLESLSQIVASGLPQGQTHLPALTTFIDRPGELNLRITGDDWIAQPDKAPHVLDQIISRLQLTATPGNVPLADAVKAQLEKAQAEKAGQ